MDIYADRKVIVREYHEERDLQAVEKLERSCELGSRRGISFLTDMMGDPLCRIRLFRRRIMLLAELIRNGELAGVIRGCIKIVGAGTTHVNIGCILGLRVSPKRRRIGIGMKLIEALELWAIRNGAQYMVVATEEDNLASTNLFVSKCNYVKVGSLTILIQPITLSRPKSPSNHIKIEKLSLDRAISLYRTRLGGKDFFPVDVEAILKEELSLGTWISFHSQEEWSGLHRIGSEEENLANTTSTPSSWVIFSLWKTYEIYKLQITGAPLFRCFHAAARSINGALPCLKILPMIRDFPCEPFGFLFVYGLHGEGERIGELMRAVWCFACNMGRDMEGCNAIVTELGSCDPLREHVPRGTSTSWIPDLWCVKRVSGEEADDLWTAPKQQPLSHFFVDPRDF